MIKLNETQSLSFINTKLWVPYDIKNRTKGMYFFTLNTTIKSIAELINDTHDRVSNNGNMYKTYYYDYMVLPKSIKSKRVVNSGLTPAKAKKQRLEYYTMIETECKDVITPLTMSSLAGKNFIYDLNPLVDLYSKQTKLKNVMLVEKLRTYFETLHNIVSSKIDGYTGGYIFVNMDDYKKYSRDCHIMHNLLLLLKRSDKIIADFTRYDMKFVFYNTQGAFTFDMSKDLSKSNFSVINRLLKRMKIQLVIKDVENTEKEIISQYIAKKAMTTNMTGNDEILPDDIIDALDSDDETLDKVVKNIDASDDDLTDVVDDNMSTKDPDIFNDEEFKKEYNESIIKKSTGKKTEASSKRDQMLRENQKNILVKGKTIEEITKDKSVVPIKEHKIELDSVTNENLKTLKFSEIDKTYMETTYQKDVINMIKSMNNASIPVNIVDIEIKDTSDSLNLKETYTVYLEDENRKRHKLTFDMPKLIDNKYMYINGNKKTLQAQFFPYPVIKTGPDEVQIVTNYQKVFINRIGAKFNKNSEKLKKLLNDPKYPIFAYRGANSNKGYLTCLEYDELAKLYNVITVGSASFIFNSKELDEIFDGKEKSTLDRILVGYVIEKGSKKIPIYYDRNNEDHIDLVQLMISYASQEVQDEFSSMSTGKKFIYNSATIMAKHMPLIILLGFFEGLDSVLRKMNDKNIKFFDNSRDKRYQYIKFKDGYLGYPLSDMEACLLFNGLAEVPTNAYTIAQMNERETYLDIFEYMFNSSYIAGALINFYDFMIDPITLEVLQILDYPTDVVSLMIFASNMLADNTFIGETDINQYRIRRNEIIASTLYKNIVRSYSRYRQTVNNPNPISISMDSNAVIKELQALPTVEDYSTLSPMVEMRKDSYISMKGANGMNQDRSYTLDKRSYDDTMIGIIGITTDPGPNCGKIREMVAEPKIKNVRGFMDLTEQDKIKDLNDSNILTPVEMLTPLSTTNDASERNAMSSKQTCHVIPVEGNCPVLVSTGMDQISHYRTCDDFSVVAKEDGKVIEYNEEGQIMVVQYKDKTTQAIDLSSHVVKNGGGGFYLANKLSPRFKNGQNFKKDDILAYDPKYYKEQGVLGNRLTMGALMKVAIISNYSTYEDSAFVTKHMSETMATNITMKKHVILGATSNVDYIVKPGQQIKSGEDLIRYDTSYDDAELNRLLASVRDDMKEEIVTLGKSSVTSHYTGVIEDVIVYCGTEIEELTPTLQKVVKDYQKSIKSKNKTLDKYSPETKGSAYRMGVLSNKPYGKVEPDQFGKIKGFNVGNGVMIEFYITYHDELSDGDKLAAFTANKNTIGHVVPRGFEPYSEFRPYEEISSPVAPSAILQRGTPSIVITGCANKVLIELKRKMYEILTGQNYDEVIKQKQPWMNYDGKSVNETTELYNSVSDDEIMMLESVFDLTPTDNGYVSSKYYAENDIVLPLTEGKDYSDMLNKFGLLESNIYIDEVSGCIRAKTTIIPSTVLSL